MVFISSWFTVHESTFDSQSLLQMLRQFGDLHALLLPGVSVAHGDGLVFERLMVNGNAKRRAYLVLPRVELADAARVVVDGAHRGLQILLDSLRKRDELRLVLRERQHRDFYRRERGGEFWGGAVFVLVGS